MAAEVHGAVVSQWSAKSGPPWSTRAPNVLCSAKQRSCVVAGAPSAHTERDKGGTVGTMSTEVAAGTTDTRGTGATSRFGK